MTLANVLVLSTVLGISSFVFGLLPLIISFSRESSLQWSLRKYFGSYYYCRDCSGKNLARLSIFGTGLLLGTAVGVIIPEYVDSWLIEFAKPNEDAGALKLYTHILNRQRTMGQ
jgi:hypothetical protein